MKMKRIKVHIALLLAVTLGITASLPMKAQDEPLPVYMDLTTWRYSDGTRELIATATASNDEGEVPAENYPVTFFAANDEEEVELGSATTGPDGKAILTLDIPEGLPMNEEGYIRFQAVSEGNDQYDMSDAVMEIKDARLEIEFAVIDSVKTIVYRGMVTNADGEEEPLADMDIYLYVPRMFSMLKIEDGWLEEDGEGEMEFPTDLVGDSAGMVKVYARITEDFDYGNLEASQEINWAIPKHSEKFEGPQRELWTPIAPLWMIITLIIMLTGVWAHYIYAMIQLYMIKKDGDKASK